MLEVKSSPLILSLVLITLVLPVDGGNNLGFASGLGTVGGPNYMAVLIRVNPENNTPIFPPVQYQQVNFSNTSLGNLGLGQNMFGSLPVVTSGGVAGFYSFENIPAGNYIVQIRRNSDVIGVIENKKYTSTGSLSHVITQVTLPQASIATMGSPATSAVATGTLPRLAGAPHSQAETMITIEGCYYNKDILGNSGDSRGKGRKEDKGDGGRKSAAAKKVSAILTSTTSKKVISSQLDHRGNWICYAKPDSYRIDFVDQNGEKLFTLEPDMYSTSTFVKVSL